MNIKHWAVSKSKHLIIPLCVTRAAGHYPIIGYKPIRKFKTQAEARLFRKQWAGKDKVQVVNTQKMAVSR